jgi:hypothetical protein
MTSSAKKKTIIGTNMADLQIHRSQRADYRTDDGE